MNKILGNIFGAEPVEPFHQPATSEAFDLGFTKGDYWNRGFKDDSLLVMAATNGSGIDADTFTIDNNFNDAAKEQYMTDNELTNDIHSSYKDRYFSEAKSASHMEEITKYYQEESAKRRFLDQQHWGTQLGVGATAELTNAPLYIGAAALLPATATALGSTAAARFITSGTAGMALEGLKDIVGEDDKTAMHYAGALLFDGTLGALFGSGRKSFNDLANQSILRTSGITDSVLQKVAKAESKEESSTIIKEAYFNATGKRADQSLTDVLSENAEYANQNFIQKGWEAARQDMAYITGQSKSSTMANFSRRLFPDATLQNLDTNAPDLATGRDILENQLRATRTGKIDQLLVEYNQLVNNPNWFQALKPTGSTQDDFSALLGEIQVLRRVHDMDLQTAVDKVMNRKGLNGQDELTNLLIRSGKAMEEVAEESFDKLQKAGHRLFQGDEITKSKDYIPFVYNKSMFAKLINEGVSERQIIDFFQEAIISKLQKQGIQDIDEAGIRTAAAGFYARVSGGKALRSDTFGSIMKDALEEDMSQSEKDLIKQILEPVYVPADEALGKSAKSLTGLDYGFIKTIQNDKGKNVDLSFDKILNHDYIGNMDQYARKMAGATTLSKYSWKMPADMTMTAEKAYKQVIELPEVKKLIEELKISRAETDSLDELLAQVDELSFMARRGIRDLIEEAMPRAKGKNKAKYAADLEAKTDEVINAIEEGSYDYLRQELNLPEPTIGLIKNLRNEIDTIKNLDVDAKAKELNALIKSNIEKVLDEAQNPKARFLNTEKDIVDFKNRIAKELNEAIAGKELTEKEAKKEMVRLETILKDLQGTPTAKDPASSGNRAYRIAHSYNVGRLLGQTFFTMPAEAMNVMWDQGLRSFIDAMPAVKSIMRAYKTGNIDTAQAKEIQESLGIYNEFLSGPKLYEHEHDYSAIVGSHKKDFVGKIESFGENFAEFTLMTGGIKPLTMIFQTAHVLGVFKKMKAVAKGGARTTTYNKMIKELGLSKNMEQAVYDSMNKYADDTLLNLGKWDPMTKEVFLVGVQRRTDSLVQMQRLGDQVSWVSEADYMFKDTIFGKIALELKQFVMTAYVKQLGRALNRKDKYMVGLIASQMTVLTLSYIAKQGVNYAGNQEKLNENLEIDKIVAGTMGMMPQGSVLPMVLNFGSNMAFGENLIGDNRHNGQMTSALSSLPIIDGANKVLQAISAPAKILMGEDSKKALKPIVDLTGINNSILTKPTYQALIAD